MISGDHNILSGNAKLDVLKDNGGPTRTHALLPDSPALNAGVTTLTTDQRGVARPQGNAPDIGAFESQGAAVETPSFVVTTLQDVTANDGLNSLREAMAYAGNAVGADTITFAPGVRGTIVLKLGELPIVRDDPDFGRPRRCGAGLGRRGRGAHFGNRARPQTHRERPDFATRQRQNLQKRRRRDFITRAS